MDTKLLIDSIVRQTTVLIAQLSTAAGIRAPLAHIADQVFVQLAQEIEAQGVGRKVVADMFGLALRTYQRKVQRLTESASVQSKTLWEAVLEFLDRGPVTRDRLREEFRKDGEEDLGAVLNDLVNEGLVYCTGRGDAAVFGLASAEDRRAVFARQTLDALANVVWQRVFVRGTATREELVEELGGEGTQLDDALALLLTDGRLTEVSSGHFTAKNFLISPGASQGWEAAVLDHFSAVVQAIAAKLERGARANEEDTIGGATLTFTIYAGHPYREEVRSLLQRTRSELNELWQRVSSYNQDHAIPWHDAEQVRFYFGQDTRPQNVSESAVPDGAEPNHPSGASS